MPGHPNEAVIRRFYEAERTGDAATLRELLADDLVWHIPGRHRFSGDHGKSEILLIQQEVVPALSETGEAVISTFSVELEDVVATDDWAFARVHWDHTRDGKRFDQRGVEVYRLNPGGRITEFWALMSDTTAFDEFFG